MPTQFLCVYLRFTVYYKAAVMLDEIFDSNNFKWVGCRTRPTTLMLNCFIGPTKKGVLFYTDSKCCGFMCQ